ncbi:MAG: hypothetical protein LBB68_00675 [Treponema sp.]|jgi:hypothetical protein|nr:hypothetical protein [Treponema sp.]
MKTEIFTFCDFAQENGRKLTIVGTFDTIIARNFPCVHPQLAVVIRIRFDMWEFNSHNFRIETVDLNGELNIEPITGQVNVAGEGSGGAITHLVFTFSNLRFTNPGVVNFVLYIDNKELSSIPLHIRKS